MEQVDLLSDIEAELYLEPASTGQRFANFLIDLIITTALSVVVLLFFFPDAGDIASRLVSALIYVAYYLILEGLTGGRTIGKFITGTIAVCDDGSPFSFENALSRSFSRIVPFEAFSIFSGRPWHDKWSKTAVVNKTQR